MKGLSWFGLAPAIVIVWTGCERPSLTAVTNAAPSNTPVVSVTKAELRDLRSEIELTGEFRAFEEADLHAKVAGFLKWISVDVGDRVERGQVIAELEAPEMTQELAQATAAANRAQLDVQRARSEVQRAEAARSIRELSYKRLAGVAKTRPNLIAQQEVDDAAARLQEAEAQLSTARATLASVEEQVQVAAAQREKTGTLLSYLRITTPFSGTVTKRYADPGAMIQAGTSSQSQARPLIRLSQTNRLRFVFPVPEAAVAKVSVGMPAEIRVESLARVFPARISRVSGRLEASTRAMDAEIEIANPTGVLKPGMYAYVTLLLDRREHVLALPTAAIGDATSSAEVRIVNARNEVELRTLRLGFHTEEFTEVTGGLAAGELVILGGAGLQKGQRVDIRNTTSRVSH
jgi:RND family efflux transporter MFP subunit